MVRIAIFAVMIVFYLIGTPGWMTERSLPSALAYPLFHANVFHLCVNLVMAYGIFAPGRAGFGQLLMGYIVSIIVYPVSSVPLIGMSNILFAVLGLRTPSLSSPWWRQPAVLVFLTVMVAMVPIKNVAGLTHIMSFGLGVCLSYVGRTIKEEFKDVGRYLR